MKRMHLINSFLSLGNLSSDSESEKHKKRIFIEMNLAGVLIGLILTIIFFKQNHPQASMVSLILAVLFVFAIFHLTTTGNINSSHYISFVTLLFCPAIGQWILGGYVASGGLMIWGISAPMGALFFQGTKQAVTQFFGYIIVSASVILLEQFFPSPWARTSTSFSF